MQVAVEEMNNDIKRSMQLIQQLDTACLDTKTALQASLQLYQQKPADTSLRATIAQQKRHVLFMQRNVVEETKLSLCNVTTLYEQLKKKLGGKRAEELETEATAANGAAQNTESTENTENVENVENEEIEPDRQATTQQPQKKRKRSSTNFSRQKKRKVEAKVEAKAEPKEPLYCLCNDIYYGNMVGCDNDKCKIEWFHYGCVGLKRAPKGKWFCPACR